MAFLRRISWLDLLLRQRSKTADCGCDVAISVLKALGATHAARMHVGKAAASPASWSERDWRMHMHEEERYFNPIVAQIDPFAAQEMEDDHNAFREQFEKYGRIVDLERMWRHSASEDHFAREMVRLGLVQI